jgi:hypothetical protein
VTLQAAAAPAVEATSLWVDAARHTLVVDLPADPLWIDAARRPSAPAGGGVAG